MLSTSKCVRDSDTFHLAPYNVHCTVNTLCMNEGWSLMYHYLITIIDDKVLIVIDVGEVVLVRVH